VRGSGEMEMSDKELVILAAKAIGLKHPGGDHSKYNDGRVWDIDSMRWWNPLIDDGDARRLAVKLGGNIEIIIGGCPYAAARRAIVRAAAEIGKNMVDTQKP
jgi:hypothetical protein